MSHFDNIVIDGIAPSFADIQVRTTPKGGSQIEIGDILGIKTSRKVTVGEQREGGNVIKRTSGSSKYEASMLLYASGFVKLLDGLAAVALQRGNQALVSLVPFDVHVIWTPPGSLDILEKRIKGCRYLGEDHDSKEGDDTEQMDVALNPLQIVWVRNGLEIAMV